MSPDTIISSALPDASATSAAPARRWAAPWLMVASGFAGLGYQVVWTQQSALWLGHEAAAVLAVVTAFFGGLAFGALALGSRIERSLRPARWYAGCEFVIALWSGVLALTLAPVSTWMLGLTGAQPSPAWQWAVAFCGTFVLLLPATAAMGATLPAMERITASWQQAGRSIAGLYAGNTLGAVLGVLATAFWLVPAFGLLGTAGVCVALNLLCGLSALVLFPGAAAPAPAPAPASRTGRPGSQDTRAALARLALTGLLGIGYEVLVVRVLAQVAEDTVYTFALLLAVYLVGTASGAAAYARGRWHDGDAARLRDRLVLALAAATLAGTASLWAADWVRDGVRSLALQTVGTSMGAALAGEALLALVAFGPSTFVMGALFSHLSATARAAGANFGLAMGLNTLGAAAAPLLFGVLAFPALGPKGALLTVTVGYLALASWRWLRRPAVWAPAAALLALAVCAPPLAFIDVPEGGHIVSYQDGVMAAVSVVEDAVGVSRLRIDNRQQEGSSASRRVDARQALLPVLLHPAPRRALFLGLGTGVTATSATEVPGLQVDAVELLPEVIAASDHFTQALGGDSGRMRIMAADARRYVRTSAKRYDVIVADNFHPARSGSGSLYTVEHFEAVRGRLAEGGLFCQWLPLHQLDLPTLRSIVRSFLEVYPGGWAMLASNSLETPVLGLVGRGDGGRFEMARLRERLQRPAPPDLARFGIEDEFALLGSFVAGPRALARFAGGAALNTDDHPVVSYLAPRVTYAPDSLPRERLIGLLHEVSIDPAELVIDAPAAEAPRRLAAYWTARHRFIETGRGVRPAADVREMLAQVREPLLSVLRLSPDFRPAYDPLLRMAGALAPVDAAAARTLLIDLMQLQPARRETLMALRAIGESPVVKPSR